MNLATVENAALAWVVTSTGLSLGSQVYLANQGIEQPQSGPFITVEIGDVSTLGIDEVENTTDLSAPAGQEITQTVLGQREFGVTLQAFGYQTITGGQGGGVTAVQALMACQTLLSRPDVRNTLNAAGLGIFDLGTVQRVDAVVETAFEGRAVLHVRFYAVDTSSAVTGYINETQATGTITAPDGSTQTADLDVVG
jgi:hypothetical protein